jgi:uncharacterized iron-regulated membrane protein
MTPAQHAARAEVLTRIDTLFEPAAVRVVKFPSERLNAFHVYLDDGSEAFVDPRSGRAIIRWTWATSPPAFLFDLHAHLLMGAAGKTLNGYLALILVFFALSGLLLWWPRRAAFRLRHPLPRRLTPGDMLRAHSASGVLLAVPVILFAVTGAAIVFYEPASSIMSTMLDRSPAAAPFAVVSPSDAPRRAWSDILAAVDATLPEAGPRMYYPGGRENPVLTFRKSLPGEWHPNGRSYVLVNPYTARVEQAIDARTQGAGTRAMHAVYPVHGAFVGRAVLVPLAVMAALGLGWLSMSGAWSYLGRLAAQRAGRRAARRREHAPRWTPAAAAQTSESD